MSFIDSFCSNIKKVIALIALMLLLTLVILIFTHTSLGYFLVLLPLTLLNIYLLHKMKELDEQESFFHSVVLAVLAFILVLCGLPKEGVLLAAVVYAAKLLYKYNRMLHPQEEQQQYNNNINNIKSISREKVYKYFKKHFNANNLVISIAGNFDMDLAVKKLSAIKLKKDIKTVNKKAPFYYETIAKEKEELNHVYFSYYNYQKGVNIVWIQVSLYRRSPY